LLSGADDQIGLPVSEALERIDDGRPLLDRYLVGDAAASLATPIALPARLLTAQGAVQGATVAFISVDTPVDGLVARRGQAARLESAADLLRAPQLTEPLFDQSPSLLSNARAVLMGLLRPVAALTPVSPKLAADGRWMPVHHSGDLALAMSGFVEDGNLVSFGLGEMCVVHSRQL
jgi:hypothetical protein